MSLHIFMDFNDRHATSNQHKTYELTGLSLESKTIYQSVILLPHYVCRCTCSKRNTLAIKAEDRPQP